uniref:Amine oxidase domain-containing protein n=1 Tax=Compsopogon caeruleus TaxID=31354 RepID=A0A7S1XFQ4_9RHOD|mmetsp:Transcript_6970/g.14442  ORF Transcript_6970/g.14442 Transcript_6970/m.14442 type:complete len:320 (+) Transcript_6970:1-960(+)
MINAGMVFSDRHYGGINYPKGGVGKISEKLAEGLERHGSVIEYKANVQEILFENGKAVGVRLTNGSERRARVIVSNATRWDTFEKLVPNHLVPSIEKKFQERYEKSPSFLSLHLGVEKDIISPDEDCHHIVLEEWKNLTDARDAQGTIFVSIPTLLDPSLAPPDRHIFHIFTPSFIEEFHGLSGRDYMARKESLADRLIARLEAKCFPGLSSAVRFREVGSARTHRKYLGRVDGSYGPVPNKRLRGLLPMPFNRTEVPGLYCVGDSSFPGQGLNAVAFSGFACGYRVAADLGLVETYPALDDFLHSALLKPRLRIPDPT